MMRGPRTWGMAVRKPDSSIVSESYELPRLKKSLSWLKWPFFRGVYVLVEQLKIGFTALKKSATYQLEEEEQVPEKAVGWTMGVGVVIFTGIFIALPFLAINFGGRLIGLEGKLAKNIVEGLLRIGFFVGYIFLISLMKDIRRVFQYHGAEHKTIYAYENDDPMQPEVVDRYSTLHVRCGTNFLFILLFLAIAAHFLMDVLLPPSVPLRVAGRILIIPVLAAVAYEVIRAAGKNGDSLLFRAVSAPGLAMQLLTTRKPTRDQIEVAIEAMESVIAREKVAEASPAEVTTERVRVTEPVIEPQPGTAPATPG